MIQGFESYPYLIALKLSGGCGKLKFKVYTEVAIINFQLCITNQAKYVIDHQSSNKE